MSLPRRLVPGQAHAVTRRTRGRCFFLKPTAEVNAILWYTLGLALERYPEVSLYALMTESSHHHASAVDDEPGGESALSKVLELFHSLAARALNALHRRGENLWKAGGGYDNTELHGEEAVLENLLYTWSQVVLCATAHKTGYGEHVVMCCELAEARKQACLDEIAPHNSPSNRHDRATPRCSWTGSCRQAAPELRTYDESASSM